MVAKIKIWDTNVGAVTWSEEEGMAYFEYDKRFEKSNWNISPLMMPIGGSHRVYSFPALRRKDIEAAIVNGIIGGMQR